MYRLLRSPWRGPLYVSSLNKSLASIGKLLRLWVEPLLFMCAGPPATLAYKKRSNNRLAEFRRHVDSFPATAFVN